MSGLSPVEVAYRPVWPVTYTHVVYNEAYLNDPQAKAGMTEDIVHRLVHELHKAGITARPDDFDFEVKPSDVPWDAAYLAGRWSGCRDAERRFRLDFHGGPLDGRTMAADKVPPIFRHTATISRDVWYRAEGIDPVDGHWLYRYEGRAS